MSNPAVNFDALEHQMMIHCQGGAHCKWDAVFIVHIHQIHQCGDTEPAYLMCRACTAAAGWRIGEMIGELYAQMPDSTEVVEAHCTSCGRRIMELQDLFTAELLAPQ